METSLHRQLKAHYAGDDGVVEVVCDGYRIDAVRGGELIEIQHGSLAAIRDKVRKLLRRHRVRLVKPIVANKVLVKLASAAAPSSSRRRSPKRGTVLDMFDELVYFTRVFPHERLVLEVAAGRRRGAALPGPRQASTPWAARLSNRRPAPGARRRVAHVCHYRLPPAAVAAAAATAVSHGPFGRAAQDAAVDRAAHRVLPARNGRRRSRRQTGQRILIRLAAASRRVSRAESLRSRTVI